MHKNSLSIILVATLLVGACKNSNKGENAVTPHDPIGKHDNKGKIALIDTVEKWIAERDHKEVVVYLIEQGATVDATNQYGWTLLHWAALNGHKEAVNLLLDKGAAVDTTDSDGLTPLHWAALNGHTAVVELLIDYGANKKATDNEGRTPLHWAAFNGNGRAACRDRV